MKRLILVLPLSILACTESSAPVGETAPARAKSERLVKAERMFRHDLDYVAGVKAGSIRPRASGLEGDGLALFCSIVKTTKDVIELAGALHDLKNQRAVPTDGRTPDELAQLWANTEVDGKELKFLPDEENGATSGATQAVVVGGGDAGIAAIGWSIAKAVGLGVDEMCASSTSDEPTDAGSIFETKESEQWSLACMPFEEGSCKAGLLCANNGGSPPFCCRTPVTSGTKCFYGVEGTCPAGEVCSNASNDMAGDWFCTKPETCR